MHVLIHSRPAAGLGLGCRPRSAHCSRLPTEGRRHASGRARTHDCARGGDRAQFLCFSVLRSRDWIGFVIFFYYFFFWRLAWQWSGLHHGPVSIKITRSYSRDVSPQPAGPFAVRLNSTASFTCVRARKQRGAPGFCVSRGS